MWERLQLRSRGFWVHYQDTDVREVLWRRTRLGGTCRCGSHLGAPFNSDLSAGVADLCPSSRAHDYPLNFPDVCSAFVESILKQVSYGFSRVRILGPPRRS